MAARSPLSLLALLLAPALSGCKAREIGVAFADKQAPKADATWVAAAKSCWPALAHDQISDASIDHQLADPLHFRAAFGAYADYSDADLITLVAHPVSAAPTPDSALLRNASTPLLTRTQAVAGVVPQNSTEAAPPADALCAIHPGLPVGFK